MTVRFVGIEPGTKFSVNGRSFIKINDSQSNGKPPELRKPNAVDIDTKHLIVFGDRVKVEVSTLC